MMLSGKQTQDEMIKSVDKGIFAVSFGGGQVDITSGKFVFNCTEAYEIINGKIGSPIKGATLIGDGPSILKEVSMVGNDMMLDPGIGTCGKAFPQVPIPGSNIISLPTIETSFKIEGPSPIRVAPLMGEPILPLIIS